MDKRKPKYINIQTREGRDPQINTKGDAEAAIAAGAVTSNVIRVSREGVSTLTYSRLG
jgi:hypothetical protein